MDIRFKVARAPERNTTIEKNKGESPSLTSWSRVASRTTQSSRDGKGAGASGTNSGRLEKFHNIPGLSYYEDMIDLGFLGSGISASRSLPTPQSLDPLNVPEVAFHTSLQADNPLNPNVSLQGLAQLSAEVNAQSYAQDYGPLHWDVNFFLEDYVNPLPTTPVTSVNSGVSLDAIVAGNLTASKALEDEREKIAMLFLRTTCHNLSIEEDSDNNPWKTIIWPMAQDYPALYHALAALACFHASKAQPHLRLDGQKRLHTSAQSLSLGLNKSGIPLDAALAATLALGFAETWDSESAATGMTHITSACILLQQMLQNRTTNSHSQHEEARLEFLYKTWTYMDVIARFTCLDLCPPVPESLVAATVGRLDFSTSKLDPLMGYATTFFPIMRRVADLIYKVRIKNALRNSPVIISQALELKREIEDWAPPVDLETVHDHSQLMTDAIQTAEAYRWSTLALLYQAVPELPNLTSYGELSQKILVYLATIPLSSPTIIVHILPLMIAGNDAVEKEDREFVRDRWKAMSQRLVTGIVERALEITEEVWKRRDEYWQAHDLSRIFGDSGQVECVSPTRNTTLGAGSPNSGGHPATTNQSRQPSRGINMFPISAAFKKGVDTITRSGCIDYTVRGKLHWLGVMKDWQWQGKMY
jgi:hypothetical protein